MSGSDCDLLPAALLERAEGRDDGAAYWRLVDAAALLAACRERRLLPSLFAVVVVRAGRVHNLSGGGPWGLRAREEYVPREWGSRVARAVDEAEAIVRRATDLPDDPDRGELVVVLRPVSQLGQGHSPIGPAHVATFIVGPFVLFGALHLVPRAVVKPLLDAVLTVIAVWVVGACLISGFAFLADYVSKRRLHAGMSADDAPRRAGASSADAPKLVAHIAIIVLLSWVWWPMGASLISFVVYLR